MTSLFRNGAYTKNRPPILRAYRDAQVAYLRSQYPDVNETELRAFVEKTVGEHIKRPMARVLDTPQPGNIVEKDIDLLTHLGQLDPYIITPSGTTYCTPDTKESLLRQTLIDKKAERNRYKKVMLTAAEVGDSVGEAVANFKQYSAKSFVNSVPGAMGSPYNVLYDRPGYNSITSTSRHCVMAGYAHTEKMVAGNLYVTSVDDVISYCTNHIRAKPDILDAVITKYRVTIPSVDTLCQHFLRCLRYYMQNTSRVIEPLTQYLSGLSDAERAYVLYAYQLHTFAKYNDHILRPFLQDFFHIEPPIDPSVDPGKVGKLLEGDLLAMVTSLNSELLHGLPLHEAAAEHPDDIRRLYAIGKHMTDRLHGIGDLLECFFKVDVDTQRTMDHPNIVRNCVMLSDTDSVIFTTKTMVEWYNGRVTFKRGGYEINAFTVYMVSRTLEHVFARLSVGFGMVGSDIYEIKMKNEFLYPVMLRTPISKHYLGRITVQEGRILPKPKKDIKGVVFRSSELSAEAAKASEAFVLWSLDTTIERDGEMTGDEILSKVVDFERRVYDSLMAGQKTFIATKAVKNGDDYDDPDKTAYFYYQLWQEVFAPKFGDIQLPNKCPQIPLRNRGKSLRDPEWLTQLAAYDAPTHERLLQYLEKNPDKPITSLILPPSLPSIPEIFRPLVNARKIIYKNGQPFYLVLRSLGIGINYALAPGIGYLVSDFRAGSAEEVIPHSAV